MDFSTEQGMCEHASFRSSVRVIPDEDGGIEAFTRSGTVAASATPPLNSLERLERLVGQQMVPLSQDNGIAPDANAAMALAQMQRTGLSRLLVVENGRLVGIISLKDLLDHLMLASELNINKEPSEVASRRSQGS